jgi:hypothetical protein
MSPVGVTFPAGKDEKKLQGFFGRQNAASSE